MPSMPLMPSRRGLGTAAAAAVTAALVSRPVPAAAAGVSDLPGLVLMSDYAGANDTEKMRSALAAVAAMSAGRRPAIVVPPGTTWATGTAPFQLFDGCQLLGGFVPETEFSYGTRVTCSGSAVFRLKQGANAQTRGVVVRNLGFEGTASTDWFEQVTDGGAGPILAYSRRRLQRPARPGVEAGQGGDGADLRQRCRAGLTGHLEWAFTSRP